VNRGHSIRSPMSRTRTTKRKAAAPMELASLGVGLGLRRIKAHGMTWCLVYSSDKTKILGQKKPRLWRCGRGSELAGGAVLKH